jgi:hypothetical protein
MRFPWSFVMDYVAAHPWSFGFFCFLAGYAAARWLYRHAIDRPPELHPEIRDDEIAAELRAGHYVEAIRLHRRRDGSGIKQARAAVDAMAQRLGVKP